jgi:hypothetical protein
MKKTKQQLRREWSEMTEFKKAKWNGFKGYCEGKRYIETSLFKPKRRIYRFRVVPF